MFRELSLNIDWCFTALASALCITFYFSAGGAATFGIIFFFHFCSYDQMKVRMTSSRHGLYKLGYTFATMMILKIEVPLCGTCN